MGISSDTGAIGLAKLVIIGGGVGGLATAVFLARRGHEVTVFEAEGRRPSGDLDEDFFHWHRPRTPQAVQPHAFMAPVRNILRREAPDIYASMLRMGAREYHEFDWFGTHPPTRPGDEDLVTTRTRRIIVETALYQAAVSEPLVDLRFGQAVEGLEFHLAAEVPHVTGVRSRGEVHHADLVLDIAGRRSPVGDWLTRAGCRPPVVENHNIGIAYFSRWYRLNAEATHAPDRVSEVSITPFAIGLVFPSDNHVFGVTLAISVNDPTRTALRDPAVFDSLAALFPGPGAWLALDAKGIDDIHIMAGLDNRWTALVDDHGPIVTGLLGVGDSITHTNPTLGQGVALALLAAQRVASTVGDLKDHKAFAADYHRWAVGTLKPWFDHQVAVDRGDEAFLSGTAGMPELDDATRMQFALNPCALEDPVVMRAKAKVRHLVEPPHEAFGTDEVRAHVARWLERHPQFPSLPPGPSRADWLAVTGEL
jgi:2-polyprenyl-6-methoxyphenol hydroxylase-like FAD-dependent oxidoreductase